MSATISTSTAPVTLKFTVAASAFLVALTSSALAAPTDLQAYEVTVTNVSQKLVRGQPWRVSPLVWLVHRQDAPLFSPGELDRGLGLRRLAEAGQPHQLALICSSIPGVERCGSVEVPEGSGQPGGLGPGDSFRFNIQAAPGDRLSLVGMVVPSHDTIWSTPVAGVLLGRQANQPGITLWDVGTEVNEAPPGLSTNQAPFQLYPDQGLRSHTPIKPTAEAPFGTSYPPAMVIVQVRITK